MGLSERDIERIAARVAKKIAKDIARELAYAQQPFLDLKGAAEFLGYSYNYFKNIYAKLGIPYFLVEVGKKGIRYPRFHPYDLAQWMWQYRIGIDRINIVQSKQQRSKKIATTVGNS